jgi:hypothetical protein
LLGYEVVRSDCQAANWAATLVGNLDRAFAKEVMSGGHDGMLLL